MSDERKFDPKKFGENLRDSIHQETHRTIHDSVNCGNERKGPRRRPLVVGIDLRGRGRGGMFVGVIVAMIGLAFLLDNMGIIAIGKLWQFWPMAIVFVGVLNFASQHRAWGTFLVLAGVLLQLNELGKIHFGWSQFWPLMLIALGLFIFWGSLELKNRPIRNSTKDADPRTTLNEAVIFGGLERRMTSQDFQGGDVTAIFGGVELDLSEANMQANEATLAITTIFGGVEMRIPPTWQVAFRGAPIFGGIEDKTRTARPADPANSSLKTLVITGAVIFGGLEIKN